MGRGIWAQLVRYGKLAIAVALPLLALLSTGTDILAHRRATRPDDLRLEILTDASLAHTAPEHVELVMTCPKWSSASDIRILVLKLENRSAQDIPGDSFEDSLRITFGEGVSLLDTAIVGRSDPSVNLSFVADGNELVMPPGLINRGDSVTVKTSLLMPSGSDSDPVTDHDERTPFVVTHRIVGIAPIDPVRLDHRKRTLSCRSLALIALSVLVAGWLIIAWCSRKPVWPSLGHKPSFTPLDLSSIANHNMEVDYRDYPTGERVFAGVLFKIDPGQSCIQGKEDRPVELVLDQRNATARAVHFLITAGNALLDRNEEGKTIGTISVIFREGHRHSVPLVLGINVREWAPGNHPRATVESVSDARSILVWEGLNSRKKKAIIDKLEIPIPDLLLDKQLSAMLFEKADIEYAVYQVYAVTIET